MSSSLEASTGGLASTRARRRASDVDSTHLSTTSVAHLPLEGLTFGAAGRVPEPASGSVVISQWLQGQVL